MPAKGVGHVRGYRGLSSQDHKVINGIMRGLTRREALDKAGLKRHEAEYFKNPLIKQEIKRRQEEMVERNHVTEDWIVERLMAIADATLDEVFEKDENGNIVVDDNGIPKYVLNQMSPRLRRALNSFDIKTYMKGRGKDAVPVQEVKVSLQDRLRALEMLGKYLGMWKEKVEVAGMDKLMSRHAEARARAFKEEEENE